ncbi:MAG TPA: ferritin-like domain-containing protein [Polyangium sp.]|nr:ferritin-like domain-containing protein [Polyangium sp.]
MTKGFTTPKGISLPPIIDIEQLGFDAGAHLLVKAGLQAIPVGEAILVLGSSSGWESQVSAWCRAQGHSSRVVEHEGRRFVQVIRGDALTGRWRGAMKAGHADSSREGAVVARASASWGLAARGATVEAGSPAMHFRLDRKNELWTDSAADLYAQAAAAQWNPATEIDWDASFDLPDMVEDAVVQVLTYLIENEAAALVVPARFLGQVHPHYREVQALLAIQVADEARHIDVFTKRLRLKGREPGLSTAGGQASLQTLLDESDFSLAQMLLSVLGEGTFVDLLHFLRQYAPDPVTRQIARLVVRDEARHVAFGMMHLLAQVEHEPHLRFRLANAIQARNDTLAATSGLNEEVFDALILLAAGEFTPAAIRTGYARVQALVQDMAAHRQARLEKLGFDESTARRLSALHTRNFM